MFSRSTLRLATCRISTSSQTIRAFSQSTTQHSLFASHVSTLQKTVQEISSSELNAKLTADPVKGPSAAFHLLDVRETHEWNEGKLPHAVYTGRGCIERDIEGIVPDQYDEIVLYCASGMRSVLAADSLHQMGYKNVKSLRGGYGGWKKDGLPVAPATKTFSDLLKEY
ncbi:hypothetical protein HKX48_002317 [Thoreauomyces humboldtii]|nr:hypothetical protein HKX48_002317 [Thoreauomyces humboldtii]